MTDDAIRDYADKMFRLLLQHPDNLREFLQSAVPELADRFDFSRAKLLDREFVLPDWRGREADLLFEIPYRLGDEERIALVFVLIEHQTRPDPRMPLRTLEYTVLYWDRCWKAWEEAKGEKGPFLLPPVLPIVLHAGARPWGSARTIADMLGEPASFHRFAPVWEPLIWELSGHSAEGLLTSDALFLQALSVVRVEDAEREEFGRTFRAAMAKIAMGEEAGSVRWTDLLNFILGWAANRRPKDDRKSWQAIAVADIADANLKRKIEAMGKTIADSYRDEGVAEGEARGEARGEAKGWAHGLQHTLLRQGRIRFGVPDSATEDAVRAIGDLERLGRLSDRMFEATSWTDLLATL